MIRVADPAELPSDLEYEEMWLCYNNSVNDCKSKYHIYNLKINSLHYCDGCKFCEISKKEYMSTILFYNDKVYLHIWEFNNIDNEVVYELSRHFSIALLDLYNRRVSPKNKHRDSLFYNNIIGFNPRSEIPFHRNRNLIETIKAIDENKELLEDFRQNWWKEDKLVKRAQ